MIASVRADETACFIARNLKLVTPRDLPELKLYRAHPASGLKRLTGEDVPPPYWAYGWAGGTVLARYILDHPKTVIGKRIIDVGTGSGVVAIAAAKAGAKFVTAIDADPFAVASARLNAEANGVDLDAVTRDAFDSAVPDTDLVLGGDVFYSADLAQHAITCFTAFGAVGVDVLIGDPGRTPLPRTHLVPVKTYLIEDFGHVSGAEPQASTVYRFKPG